MRGLLVMAGLSRLAIFMPDKTTQLLLRSFREYLCFTRVITSGPAAEQESYISLSGGDHIKGRATTRVKSGTTNTLALDLCQPSFLISGCVRQQRSRTALPFRRHAA